MSDYVQVMGVGEASAEPDTAVIDLGIEAHAAQVADALDRATARVRAVHAALRDMAEATVSVQTTSIGIQPRYTPHGEPTGDHSASQQLRVRVSPVEVVGEVIAAMANAGGDGLTVGSVDLVLGDPSALADQARASAFADASKRAQTLATAAGRTLGTVIRVMEISPNTTGVPGARLMKAYAEAMPIEAGTTSVSVTLVARWGWA